MRTSHQISVKSPSPESPVETYREPLLPELLHPLEDDELLLRDDELPDELLLREDPPE